MKKRGIIYIIVAVVIAATVLSNNRSSCSGIDADNSQELESPTPINMLLDNSMSSFDDTKSFDREIETFMRRWELKGGSFALMRGDSLLYAKGYGVARDTTRCDVNNVFRVASASKLITATAVMKLVEDGTLSLSSQVFGTEGILCDTMFLDLYTPNLKKITVEHLLRHTSGLASPHGDPAFANPIIARVLDRELPLTLDDMVYYATRSRLRYQPGGSYDYSNLGYMILTKVIEKSTGMGYEQFVQDSILAPVGCYNMFIGRNFSEDRPTNEVDYYEVKEATPVEAYDGSGRLTMKSDGGNNVTLLSGAGGWVASPTELLRFVASINGEGAKADILSLESIHLMTDNDEKNHPIGWATIRGESWLRSGSMAGTSVLIKRQEDGYTWIFVSNSSAWIGHRISNYISSHISRALLRVKEWPERDLFEVSE